MDYSPLGSFLSMGLSRQEYWSGLPCPPPGDLPDPGIQLVTPASPALQADSLPIPPPGKAHNPYTLILIAMHTLTSEGF